MVLVGKGGNGKKLEPEVNIKAKTEHSKARVGAVLFREMWIIYVHKRGAKAATFKHFMALHLSHGTSTIAIQSIPVLGDARTLHLRTVIAVPSCHWGV